MPKYKFTALPYGSKPMSYPEGTKTDTVKLSIPPLLKKKKIDATLSKPKTLGSKYA